ncbi:hypothetical protein GM658_04755 [Pseudoduganella eburnea]|uniref:Uncharacterized protein n=2 Tax=Massilia eburnea TaxID=1776165 RepID=A0A6L6QBP1_9BURK|nr:hypothetical protein [Massilia eburnea]
MIGASHAFAATEGATASKKIHYRGGLVVFAIPEPWIEEYEPEGGGIFYQPGEDTATLRLNVITATRPSSSGALSGKQVLSSIGYPASEILSNGNAISKGIRRGTERGTPITIFWWHLVNVVSPQQVRVATFTYTVFSSSERSASTIAELSFVEDSVRSADFTPDGGKH